MKLVEQMLKGKNLAVSRVISLVENESSFIKTIEHKLTHKLLKSIEQDGQLSSYVEKEERGELESSSAADEILVSGNLLTALLRQ